MSVITEIHGWINIKYTYENSEKADDLSNLYIPEILVKIEKQIQELNFSSAEVRLIKNYGENFITVCGFSWHVSDFLDCLTLYKYVAEISKGSYGILYSINHDENNIRVFVMKKGILTEHEDNFLSPFIPKVEDFYSE